MNTPDPREVVERLIERAHRQAEKPLPDSVRRTDRIDAVRAAGASPPPPEPGASITIEGWTFTQEGASWRGTHTDGRRTGLHLSLRAARWAAGIRPDDEPLDILALGQSAPAAPHTLHVPTLVVEGLRHIIAQRGGPPRCGAAAEGGTQYPPATHSRRGLCQACVQKYLVWLQEVSGG